MMKKWIALLLAVWICLPLGGCSKTEAVKNVETMIASLGTITADSKQELYEIADVISDLNEEEQAVIGNNRRWNKAKDCYFELVLPGVWYSFQLLAAEPDKIYEPRFSLTFQADHTVVSVSEYSGTTNGEWVVKNGKLQITGLSNLESEHSSAYSKDRSFSLGLELKDGAAWLVNDFYAEYIKEDEYDAKVGEVIRVVDCETDDLSEVFGFTSYTYHTTDEWGAHTGSRYETVCLQNKLYEQGWCYLRESEGFALEVCFPEYKEYFTFEDGGQYIDEIAAGSYTLTENPFNYMYRPLHLGWSHPDQTVTTDLKLEDLSVGRGKGKLYFINEKYIKEIINNENSREMLLEAPGEYQFLGGESRIFFGVFEENNQDY